MYALSLGPLDRFGVAHFHSHSPTTLSSQKGRPVMPDGPTPPFSTASTRASWPWVVPLKRSVFGSICAAPRKYPTASRTTWPETGNRSPPSAGLFHFNNMLFTKHSQNGAQIVCYSLHSLARPHAGYFFGRCLALHSLDRNRSPPSAGFFMPVKKARPPRLAPALPPADPPRHLPPTSASPTRRR